MEIKIERGKGDRIKITIPYNPVYIWEIKSFKGYVWHPVERYWTIPYSERALGALRKTLGESHVIMDRPEHSSMQSPIIFEDLRKVLVSRKYSPKTVKSYIHYNREFLTFTASHPEDISNDEIMEYLFHLASEKKVSTSTMNVAINALRFYYGKVRKKKFVFDIKRPGKDKKLPVVMSKEEIARILGSIRNPKHFTPETHAQLLLHQLQDAKRECSKSDVQCVYIVAIYNSILNLMREDTMSYSQRSFLTDEQNELARRSCELQRAYINFTNLD